ncbi:PEST proteolytic signal-containing nuclear protein [Neodiprion pinetum]|uniref:PEST proteolytic signal-containing nuclear protein n=1 Tax=Neodiprion lecontei TaxID=441921 RepID=A0A6J0CFH8_NEOLC|nr:PEST proteolytic signal-containing nuclear protein [Neodiprion lecontei]XP_046410388.1 PEST proteolytic signal-containing nuclear protein-like [Neodiprion fabricii]XP_046493311.1 PEST proteolytic signal-containing nuclear protein-like [Neodiprion pinetum]XP_046630007.1 PEST proteolytic signal-containing nuclear protein-like [Neodiprion virginianus]
MSKRNSTSEDYRKGSSAYRAADRRGDDWERDRSPLRDDVCNQTSSDQTDHKKQKLTFGFGKKPLPTEQKKGIQIKLGSGSKPSVKPAAVQKPTVASVFNADDDDEPEEMPAEARMRMRNIGRETPTSAGPNSFGKTKQGFCDSKKIFEKTLKRAMEEAHK